MKTRIAALLIMVTSSLLCIGQENINGDFTQCIAMQYDYKFGEIDSLSKRIRIENKYNSLGKIIVEKDHDFFNYKDIKYEYDSFGNVIKKTINGHLSSEISKIEIFRYTNNLLIEEVVYNKKGEVFLKYFLTYNDKSTLIENKCLYADGTIFLIFKYSYDAEGLKTENVFSSTGELLNKFVEKFDSNGLLKESVGYFPSGELMYKRTYEYDINGNKSKDIIYNVKDGSISKTTVYQYNSMNNLIEFVDYNELNEPVMKIVYSYSKE
jgi:hypothetical protein